MQKFFSTVQYKCALPDEMSKLQHQSVTSFKCQKQDKNKNTHNEKMSAFNSYQTSRELVF